MPIPSTGGSEGSSGCRKLIAIVGATATGKTSLAIALSKRMPCEVVGADSRQVYRHMDIGTAKPTPEELAALRHHVIGVVDPDEPFSLGRWLEMARAALDGVWSRGKQPLLVGGTGQYVWALLEGWRVPRVPPQPGLRRELLALAPADLAAELQRVDPEALDFIDLRNVRRVARAIEVYQVTGKPLSFWRAKEPPDFDTLAIGLALPRDELYRRIDARVDEMVRRGFVDEVRSLLGMGYARTLPSMSSIGYGEMCAHLAGEMDLATAVARTKTGTHRLARHQNSWFKAGDPRIHWVQPGERGVEEAWGLVAGFCARQGRVPG